MSPWAVAAGVLAGLGVFLLVRELVPAPARLDAALARLDPGSEPGHWPAAPGQPAGPVPSAPPDATPAGYGSAALRSAASHLAAAAPWLPVPAADLTLLGLDRQGWLASKIGWGLAGLAVVPVLSAVVALGGAVPSLAGPAVASVVLGTSLFCVPDVLTRIRARDCRADFRHALSSYLDLVGLERGAGAGPTEALEAAAAIGGGWAFRRISAALESARRSGTAPWTALAALAAETGVRELSDLADIAEVAGNEGARILQTLAARAESMRAEALAADRARAGARSTTMVVPIALLGAGFLLLLIFPILYRTVAAG
jgi:hypothetical protein